MVKQLQIATTLIAALIFTSSAFAQREGGGGCMNGGRAPRNTAANQSQRTQRGPVDGISMLQQLTALNQAASNNQVFTGQNPNGRSRNTRANGRREQPTPEQFTHAAMGFDEDGNHQLDETEIARMSNAMVVEFQKQRTQTPAVRVNRPLPPVSTSAPARATQHQASTSTEQMAKAFAKRAMTFDADQSQTLDISETQRLAAAFLRTLR